MAAGELGSLGDVIRSSVLWFRLVVVQVVSFPCGSASLRVLLARTDAVSQSGQNRAVVSGAAQHGTASVRTSQRFGCSLRGITLLFAPNKSLHPTAVNLKLVVSVRWRRVNSVR
jgi:hypothetical protein